MRELRSKINFKCTRKNMQNRIDLKYSTIFILLCLILGTENVVVKYRKNIHGHMEIPIPGGKTGQILIIPGV